MKKKKKEEFVTLTSDELRRIEHSFFAGQIENGTMATQKANLSRIEVELSLLKAQYDLKLNQKKELMSFMKQQENKLNQISKTHREIKEEIRSKYDLQQNWGFDPETGRVK